MRRQDGDPVTDGPKPRMLPDSESSSKPGNASPPSLTARGARLEIGDSRLGGRVESGGRESDSTGPHALASELHATAVPAHAGPHALASELHATAISAQAGPHALASERHAAAVPAHAGPHALASERHATAVPAHTGPHVLTAERHAGALRAATLTAELGSGPL